MHLPPACFVVAAPARRARFAASRSARRNGSQFFTAASVVLACLVAVVALPEPWAVLLVAAPLVEEVVFRTGLQAALMQRWRRSIPSADLLANAVTAAAFTAAHLVARPGLAAALVVAPALLIGSVYRRTRRIELCVAIHAAFNAVWLLAGGLA